MCILQWFCSFTPNILRSQGDNVLLIIAIISHVYMCAVSYLGGAASCTLSAKLPTNFIPYGGDVWRHQVTLTRDFTNERSEYLFLNYKERLQVPIFPNYTQQISSLTKYIHYIYWIFNENYLHNYCERSWHLLLILYKFYNSNYTVLDYLFLNSKFL